MDVLQKIVPAGLVRHLGQVFGIDMDEPRLVAFEGFVGLRGIFGLERVKVAYAVAAKTPIKARARGLRAKKLAGDGQQMIQRQKKRLSETTICSCAGVSVDFGGVGRMMKTVSAHPFVNGAFTHAVTQRQSWSSLRAGRHLRSDGGRGACVFVQVNIMTRLPVGLLG